MLKNVIKRQILFSIKRRNYMIDENTLIEYLKGEMYLLSDNDGSEEYENEHQYELGNNRMIEKTIRWIEESKIINKSFIESINKVYEDMYNQESISIDNAINTLKNLECKKDKDEYLLK